VEARAGNKSVVHHAVMFVRPPGVRFLPDAQPGVPYVPPKSEKEPDRKTDTGAGAFQYTGAVQIVGVYVPAECRTS
jgi:hypothetical protein